MPKIIFRVPMLLALTASAPAMAQVYKCDVGDRVIYSDVPCAAQSGQTKLDIQAAPAPATSETAAARGKNSVMQRLDTAVRDALSKNDIARAEKLALTKEHWDWINEAKAKNPSSQEKTVADKSSSAECQAAQQNYQQGFDSTADGPEDMEARAKLVREACGTPEVEPTYTQRPPYINRPAFGAPYLPPNSSQPGAAIPSPMGGRANAVK